MNPALAKQIVLPSKLELIFKKIFLAQDSKKVVLVARSRDVCWLEVKWLVEDVLSRVYEEVKLFVD